MESYPHSFESGGNEPKPPSGKSGEGSAKRFAGWTPDAKPRAPIERVGAEVALPKATEFTRPLGEQKLETPKLDPESFATKPESEIPAPHAQELGRAAAGREVDSPEDFFAFQEREFAEHADDASIPSGSSKKVTKDKKVAPGHPEPLSSAEELELPSSLKPQEHGTSAAPEQQTLGNTETAEKTAGEPLAPEAAELPAHIEAIAGSMPDALAEHPDVAHDRAEHTEFADFIRKHGELADLSALSAEMAASPAGEASSEVPASDDETFRNIAMHEGEPDPGPAAWHEGEPGTLPTAAGGDMPPRRPFPPTAEGSAFGPDDNRDFLQPAGNVLAPGVLTGSVLEARRHMDNLRHLARERSLAAAVSFLGLGLVLEHFSSKHRDKKLKRQIKAQGAALDQTNEAFTKEQAAHRETKQQLETLATAQHTTAEQLRGVQKAHLPELQKTAIAGAAGAAASAELARHHARQTQELATENGRAEVGEPDLAAHQAQLEAVRAGRIPETAAVTATADALREAMRHERLQDKLAATPLITPTAATTTEQARLYASLPSVATDEPETPLAIERQHERDRQIAHRAKQWTWIIVGLIVVAILASMAAF